MSQTLVLDNFIKYLQVTNNEQSDDIKKRITYLKEGHCFGFSLCYGSMKLLGELAWWKAALMRIANWNGSLEDLNKPITLPQQKETQTLEKVIKRAMNYVISMQLYHSFKNCDDNVEDGFGFAAFEQQDVLKRFSKVCEMVDSNGVIQSVKYEQAIAGFFDTQTLTDYLDPEDISHSIFLVTNKCHALCVTYEDTWTLYAPEYPHNKTRKIVKKFKTKEDLARELMRILGQSLILQIASFDKPFKTNFAKTFVKNGTESFLAGSGLPLIYQHSSRLLKQIFDKFKDSTLAPDLFAQSLVIKLTDTSGLQWAIYRATRFLPQILTFVEKSEAGPRLLANALVMVCNQTGMTGLHVLVYKTPALIPSVLKLIEKYEKAPELICKTITCQDHDGWTALYTITRYAPKHLKALIEFIANSPSAPEQLLQALTIRNNEGVTGLQTVAKYASANLVDILTLASKCNVKENKDYESLQVVFDNLPSKKIQCFLNLILANITVDLIKLLEYLPKQHGLQSQLAKTVVIHLIDKAENTKKVRQIIGLLENNRNKLAYLFDDDAGTGHQYCWKGGNVSASWIQIINQAKEKIVTLALLDKRENAEDAAFLKMNTQQGNLFSVKNDYYQRYQENIAKTSTQKLTVHL